MDWITEKLAGAKLDELCWDYDYREEQGDHVPSYAADFETTTKEDDCRVWAWASCEVGNIENEAVGNSIESFMRWLSIHTGSRVYFHNLKFDGKFIVDHLLMNGWKWVPCKEEAEAYSFTTLISDMSQWYSVRLFFDEGKQVELLDSLKVIPLSIAAIPAAFGLSTQKLRIDYKAERYPGHELTLDEREYVLHDVQIAAQALHAMFAQGMKRMTAGSNAFHDYRKMIGGRRRFRDWFPEPDYDRDMREGGCYKGGFTAVNPMYAGREVGPGISFDVNSLYPSVMASAHGEVLPWGEPLAYEGRYEDDPEYPIYVQFIEADISVKPGRIPCLQLKGNPRFGQTEYIRDTEGMVTMCLTNVDLELMLEQYDVWDIRYIRGYKFKGARDLFKDYVEKWTAVKTQATIDGNKGLRTIAKLELNSLYGKFATNPVKQSRRPVLGDDGIVRYELLPEEHAEPVYLPIGCFVTAYARAFTIRAAQANYDRWLYCDTDSCYLLGTEPPRGMKVDAVELGAWKQEHGFDSFKALRAKTYCFTEGGELHVTCAGMPSRCHGAVTMDNFEYGSSFEGKLRPKDVPGGTILVDDVFTIRERS